MESGNVAWMLTSASLVLLMTPGLALFYGGMVKGRSILNMMMMSFGSMGVIGVVYMLWGYSMSYGEKSIGGFFANPFQWFGLGNGAVFGADGELLPLGESQIIDVAFQVTFAIITTALISGALADRVKYSTWLLFTAIWVTFCYFPLAHMVWGGGFLADGDSGLASILFGSTDGEANVPPIDFAGGTVVHINAGMAALVLAILIGSRRGWKKDPARPNNLPLVMLGAALLWFGWFGFNAGSAGAANEVAGLAWVNTTGATAAAILGWLLVEKLRDGHPTSLGAASGIVAGLVAITPAADSVNPVGAIIIGTIAGALCAMAVGLKNKFGYDDSLDVVGVHFVGGLVGTIALGFLATGRGLFTGGDYQLLVVQIAIALFAILFSGIVTLVIALILKATVGWRISDDDEATGIDLTEHGESAYESLGVTQKEVSA